MTDRDVDSFFSHGGEYQTSGEIRGACCSTCAFRNSPDTVRPAHVTIEELDSTTDLYDDFICHTPDEDGKHPSCAGWHARRKT